MDERKTVVNSILYDIEPFVSSVIAKLDYLFEGKVDFIFKEDDYTVCIAALQDGRIITGSNEGTLRIINLETKQIQSIQYAHKDDITVIKSFSNNRIVTGSNNGSLKVWTLFIDNIIFDFDLIGHTSLIMDILILNDGRIATSEGPQGTNEVRVWDPVSGECELILPGNTGGVFKMISTNDKIICACWDNIIRIWDLNTQKSKSLHGHTDSITGLGLLSGNRLVSISTDGYIRLWDLKKVALIDTISTVSEGLISLLIVPGDIIVVGARNGKIYLYKNTSFYGFFHKHATFVTDLALLPDGQLVSFSSNIIRTWNLDKKEPNKVLFEHKSYIQTYIIVNNQLITAGSSDDKQIIIWK